ncbi:glycosyltransferase family 4 protein [Rhodohalobacter sp. 8-1]|uniref:glycosyltransferase family 4 protein n=1 Tax=Rhodohalobacter sp. 8-1 TaxID=3131972 RepID=UPI0030EC20B5
MSHLKVALFTGNYNHIRDGVSLTLNKWVSFLIENNADVLVFGPTVENPDVDHVGELSAVPSIQMPGRPEYRITTGFPDKNREQLEKFQPDIVHIATPDILGFKALKWAVKSGVPIVSSYHTHFTSYLKYYNLGFIEKIGWTYLRWFYKHCEQIYVPTKSMAAELREKDIGRTSDSLKIWARGVDTDQFNPSKRDLDWRKKMGFKDNDIVFTFVSRLVWEKNLKLFASVVSKLQEKYPSVRSMIVGDGPAREELEEMAPATKFTGFLKGDELACAYASSDVFFFPSDTETFGNVTLEAMACGLPCLVADAQGSKSLVDHGENGYLVPVENETGFFSYAEKLAKDEMLRIKLGDSSLEKAMNYTWEKINSDLLNHYMEVLEISREN